MDETQEALSAKEIRGLILERGLTVRAVIEAVSSLQEFTFVGLENFDRNIKYDALRRNNHVE